MTDASHYDYVLPRELVAQNPLGTRSDARLLLVDRATQKFHHWFVRDLHELLDERDCIVINDTRVVPARLVGVRTLTGGAWEGLFLQADPTGCWELLGKTRGKLMAGETVTLHDHEGNPAFKLALIEKRSGGVWRAIPEHAAPAAELLEQVGRVPLPPYIRHGEMNESDRQRYQTVYARNPGSAAAPTAGLHFTNDVLNRLVDRGVTICRLTLHVGLDTFRPIGTERIEDHPMHRETGIVDRTTVDKINRCRAAGGRCVAVGTTSVRVLETAAQNGSAGPSGQLEPWSGATELYIRPGFQFRAVDAMMTNFHLPRTTLLVLVRTFGGDELIMRAYEEAIRERYRFFSYGDAMLIV